jgi:hypothetical protein
MTAALRVLNVCTECGYYHGGISIGDNAWTRDRGNNFRSLYPQDAYPTCWITSFGDDPIPRHTYFVDRDGDLWIATHDGMDGLGNQPAYLYSNDALYDCALIKRVVDGDGSLNDSYGPYLIIHNGIPPLEVPTFTSLAEAEAWLEAHA